MTHRSLGHWNRYRHRTLTVVVMVARLAWRPGWQVAQAHGAVERLVAQSQRGHGAAAAAVLGSRRLSGASVRPPSASVRHCRASAAFFLRFFCQRAGAGGGGTCRPMAARCPSPRPPPPSRPLFTCRILKGFSACRYGFSSRAVLHTGRTRTGGGSRLRSALQECRFGIRVSDKNWHSTVHSFGRRLQFLRSLDF